MATLEEDALNAVHTIIKQAQKGVIAPEIREIVDPNEPSLKALVAILPRIDQNGSQGVEVMALRAHLDACRPAPQRRKGVAKFEDLQSLIDHINVFKRIESMLFASRGDDDEKPSIQCVYDYHSPTTPGWRDHKAEYVFPLSDEWTAWTEKNASPMSQTTFARFVEDHLTDVCPPESAGATAKVFSESIGVTFATAAKLLELSQGLSMRCEQVVTNIQSLNSGETNMVFVEEHKDSAGQPLRVPGAFIIGIPVFRSGERYQIPVRLRYRKDGQRLMWFFELYRADAIFDFAFRDSCNTARDKTALPLLFGSPE